MLQLLRDYVPDFLNPAVKADACWSEIDPDRDSTIGGIVKGSNDMPQQGRLAQLTAAVDETGALRVND